MIGKKYKLFETIGEGTYGKVYKIKDVQTQNYFAAKCFRLRNYEIDATTVREIAYLKELCHEHIITIQDIIVQKTHIYMVIPYINTTLSEENRNIPPSLYPIISLQLIKAVKCCHDHGIVHRDIKPTNVLYDVRAKEIKLIDFGLAIKLYPGIDLETNICSLWYRPPDIILGNENYSFSIDMWSLGCTLSEIHEKKPLFIGNTESEIINSVWTIFGTPTEGFLTTLCHYNTFGSVKYHKKGLNHALPNCDYYSFHLLESMLQCNPHDRITASEALGHSYFT